MARKKEERVVAQDTLKKQKQVMESYLADDVNFVSFKAQLMTLGLELRDIPGDGNCLFRGLGDQFEGHSRNHYKHRLETVQFMREHKLDFEPFVEDDVPFERYLTHLKKPGTYAGNDSIVAFARNHGINIVIHQLNSPVWQIEGTDKINAHQLHISYHNGDHYSSVRKIGDFHESPTNIKLKIGNENELEATKTKNIAKTKQKPHKETVSGVSVTEYVEGMAQAVRGLTDVEEHVINATGCLDEQLVRNTLEDNLYDVDASVAVLLSVMSSTNMEMADGTSVSSHHTSDSGIYGTSVSSHRTSDSGIWSDSGTGTRLFGKVPDPQPSGARPKQNQSLNTRQKRDKKFEKKKRAEERHRQKVWQSHDDNASTKGARHKQESSESDNDSSTSTVVLANGVGMLSI